MRGWARWVLIGGGLLAASAGALWYGFRPAVLQGRVPAPAGLLLRTVATPVTHPLTVLIMGVDEDKTRTDIVIVAHWEPEARRVNLVSLPRDSLVDIPCPPDLPACISPDKLGHAHAYGTVNGTGPALARATVEAFLGIQIDRYVRFDFESFKAVVDALGGIDLDVEQDMADINLQAGLQHLDGAQALAYVRWRSDGEGDIGRIKRTQHFLATLAHTTPVSKWPTVWRLLAPRIGTDLDNAMALDLLRTWADTRGTVDVELVSLAGEPLWFRNLWFWKIDQANKAQVVNEYLVDRPHPPGGAASASP